MCGAGADNCTCTRFSRCRGAGADNCICTSFWDVCYSRMQAADWKDTWSNVQILKVLGQIDNYLKINQKCTLSSRVEAWDWKYLMTKSSWSENIEHDQEVTIPHRHVRLWGCRHTTWWRELLGTGDGGETRSGDSLPGFGLNSLRMTILTSVPTINSQKKLK